MNSVLTIALQTLRIVWRDKTSFVWMLIIPSVYIFFFGQAFKYESDPTKSKADLGIYNRDAGFLSTLLIDGIRSENIRVDSLSTRPEQINTRLLVVPEDFTQNILAGEKSELDFETRSGSNVEAEMAAELAIRKSYIRILADLVELNTKNDSIALDKMLDIRNRQSLVALNSSYAGKHKIVPSGYNHQVPANIVMFTMLIIFIYAGHMVMDEKKSGIFRRIYCAPLHFSQLFLGKLLGGTLIGLMQIAMKKK